MEDVEISERPDKIDENDQRMDRDDDHQIITLGHIPKSCDAEFIQCGDGLSSGTNEVNIKISKKHATRLEDGKLIPLDRMSWWEPNNECWQYFLNEICEDYFVDQSKPKPTDLAKIWSHFLEEGNLPKNCIIVSNRDCGGEFKNENFNDGKHWYVRYYLAEDGEIYNEQIVLMRIT